MKTIGGKYGRYTSEWDETTIPRAEAPRLGSLVAVPEDLDGREWNGFSRVMRQAGRDFEFVRYMPRAKRNVFRIVREVSR